METIKTRLLRLRDYIDNAIYAIKAEDANKFNDAVREIIKADAAGFNKAELIGLFRDSKKLKTINYSKELVLCGLRETADPKVAVENLTILIWDPNRDIEEIKKEIVKLLDRFDYADFYRLRYYMIRDYDTFESLLPIPYHNCANPNVPAVEERLNSSFMMVIDNEVVIWDRILNASDDELAHIEFVEMNAERLAHLKSDEISKEDRLFKSCFEEDDEGNKKFDMEKLNEVKESSSLAYHTWLKLQNKDYKDWFLDFGDPKDLSSILNDALDSLDEPDDDFLTLDDIPEA